MTSPGVPSPWEHALKPFLPGRKACIVWLLLLAGLLASPLLLKAYHRFYARKLLLNAEKMLEQKNYPVAVRLLRESIVRDAKNPRAIRIMRDMVLQLDTANAVAWSEKLYEVEPTFQNFSVWVQLVFQRKDFPLAGKILDSNAARHGNEARYHVLCSIHQAMQGQWDEAEKAMARAWKLDPVPDYGITLDSLRLESDDPGIRHKAEASLAAVQEPPERRFKALRELLDYQATRKIYPAVQKTAEALVEDAHLDSRRAILMLEVLYHHSSAEYPRAVRKALEEERRPYLTPRLLKTLLNQGESDTIIAWSGKNQSWLGVSPEFAGLVLLAMKKKGGKEKARQWASGVDWGVYAYKPLLVLGPETRGADFWKKWAAGMKNNPHQMRTLSREALLYENGPAYKAISWELIRHPESGLEIFADFSSYLFDKKNTEELYWVSRTASLRFPKDPRVMNNVAVLGLLTGNHVKESHESAEKNMREFSAFPPVYTTRALSLLLQGRKLEALECLEAMPAELKAFAAFSFYHKLILRALDRDAGTLTVEEKKRLLPEEIKLWERYW